MSKKSPAVLGVFVTDSLIESVLVRPAADKTIHVVGRYAKPRARRGERMADLAGILPGLMESTVSDYTMEVGDGSRSKADHDIYLAGELESLGVKQIERLAAEKGPRRETTPFGPQLREILADCRTDGYESPQMVFCLGSSEISYHELALPARKESGGKLNVKGLLRSDNERTQLLQKLGEVAPPDVENTRVAFVPMTKDNSRRRFLAVAPFKPDPVAEAIDAIARKTRNAVPSAHIVDSEATLLADLVRRQPDARVGVVGIVRVNANDTMIMFLREGVLDRYELLRSLTTYDPVDTICSRVLLKQDELKIGKVDDLYVVTEHGSDDVIETFQSFFPDSNVSALQDALVDRGIALDEKIGRIRPQTLPALAVAIRQIESWTGDERTGAPVNLLARKRRGVAARKKSPVRWHTYAMGVLLFAATMFYTIRYMSQQESIDRREAELALNPPDFPTQNPDLLKQRVDSLNAQYALYNRALLTLDSLLIGSDQWSRTLEGLSRSTNNIGRIWLTAWSPWTGGLNLEGNALERNRIARLAQEWNGSIDQLTFSEVQGIRVYMFSMTVPIAQELPKVAQYLRENSLDDLAPAEVEALAGLAEASRQRESN